MNARPDPTRGEDLRMETRLSPGVLLVSYRAPGPGHPLREAYDRLTAAASRVCARACLDMAASGEPAGEKAA